MHNFKLLIGGQLVDGAAEIDVINPATGKAFAQAPVADVNQLNAAVAAANQAFGAWSVTTISRRGSLVATLAECMAQRADELVQLLTSEQGKPLDQARMEIMASIGVLRAFSQMDIPARVLRENEQSRVLELRRPLGVVAAITPWNFPIVLLIHKLAPALLAGNTLVVKPAPSTPLTTLLLGEICQQVLPAGVVNVVTDRNDLGPILTAHPDVVKVAFTGSTATGKHVFAAASATLKRMTLELGGNDAAIVLDDVDPVEAARKIYRVAMANAGQMCVAIKRTYVPSKLYDAFCAELVQLANAAVVGEGTVAGVQVGPVQNQMQFDKLKELLEDTRQVGNVIAGGHVLDRPGYFVAPTIVRDLTDDARVVREEQFGPILPVLSYDSVDEVVARVNASEFGLGGSVWGRDVGRAVAVAGRIVTGTVCVNHSMPFDAAIPFRGIKQSGVGAELGLEGLLEYTQATVINVNLTA